MILPYKFLLDKNSVNSNGYWAKASNKWLSISAIELPLIVSSTLLIRLMMAAQILLFEASNID